MELLDELTFPRLPEIVGYVAHESLQEQDEADPLVPGVPDLITLLGHPDQVGVVGVQGRLQVVQGGDTRVRHLGSDLSGDLRRDGECAVDPAVGVHYALNE